MNRAQKIEQILALMSGAISPADILPRLEITFIEEEPSEFMVNGKVVDKETFLVVSDKLPYPHLITCHGRKDNNEEFYL
jgi:hypothetical protein